MFSSHNYENNGILSESDSDNDSEDDFNDKDF